MSEEALLNEIKTAPQRKRDAILSYAYFVLHGEAVFHESTTAGSAKYIPFRTDDEVNDFLEFHQRQTGIL